MTTGAGSVDLGSAHGSIGVDFSGAESAFRQALGNFDSLVSGGMVGIGQRIEAVGDKITGIGAKLTAQLSPISAFVGGGVLVFSNFDAVLTEIEARTGATADQMAVVRETALQMGQDTAFSAQDAAQAMLELLSSGYDLDQTMQALKPTLDAAAASGMGLGAAADAVTDILSQFRLGASDAGMVADVLAQAAASSSATMAELVQGFGNVGPIANEFGLSVEQTAAILAVFAENGIKGAEAGTQLRSMLTNMTRNTEDVTGMWKQLGVSMFDAEGNMRDINEVIRDLDAAMVGMSDQERIEVINTLAGSYGQMGLSALVANDGISDMMTSMRQQTGAAEVAQKKMNSFRGIVDTLMSTMETFSINVLGPMVEKYLEPLIKQVTEIINQWSEWAARNPEMAAKLGLVLGVLAVLGPVLVAIGTFISLAGTAIAAFGTVLGFVLSPLGLLIALIVALGAAYATNFLGFRDFVDNLLPLLKAGFEELINIFNRLKAAFEEGGLSGLFEQLKTEVANAWPVILSLLQTGLNLLVSAVKEYGPQILAGLAAGLIAIGSWAYDNILIPIWNALADQANWQKVGSFLSDVLAYIISVAGSLGEWAKTNILNPLWEAVTNPQNWQKVASFIGNVFGFLLQAAFNIADWAMTNVLGPLWETMTNPTNWQKVGQFIGSVFRFLLDAAFDIPSWAITNVLAPLWETVTDPANWEKVRTFLQDAFQYVANNAPDWFNWVKTNVIDPFVSAINQQISQVPNAIISGITSGLDAGAGGLASSISNMATGMISGFMNEIKAKSPSRLFADAAAFIPEGIALGINENMQTAIDALGSMTSQLGMMAPTNAAPALAPAGTGGSMNNFNFSGLTIQIPPGAIRPGDDPQQQGEGIAKGFWDYMRKTGGGLVGET